MYIHIYVAAAGNPKFSSHFSVFEGFFCGEHSNIVKRLTGKPGRFVLLRFDINMSNNLCVCEQLIGSLRKGERHERVLMSRKMDV